MLQTEGQRACQLQGVRCVAASDVQFDDVHARDESLAFTHRQRKLQGSLVGGASLGNCPALINKPPASGRRTPEGVPATPDPRAAERCRASSGRRLYRRASYPPAASARNSAIECRPSQRALPRRARLRTGPDRIAAPNRRWRSLPESANPAFGKASDSRVSTCE